MLKQFFSLLKRYILPYRKYLTWALILNFLSQWLNVFSFMAIVPILNILFKIDTKSYEYIPMDIHNLDKDVLINNAYYFVSNFVATNGAFYTLAMMGGILIFMTMLKTAGYFASAAVMVPLRTGIVRDIRIQVYNKVLSLPLSFFSEERKGDIIARMSADVTVVENSLTSSIDMLIRNPIALLVCFVTLFSVSWQMTLFVIFILPLTGWIMGVVSRKLKRQSSTAQAQWGDIMSQLDETLGGLRVIKAFIAESKMSARFSKTNNDFRDAMNEMIIRQSSAHPMSEFLGTCVIVTVLLFGGALILNTNYAPMDAATFIFYLIILYSIINPLKEFSRAFYNIPQGLASMERIDMILKAENHIVEPEQPLPADLKERMLKSINFQTAYSLGENLAATCLDLAWHELTPDEIPSPYMAGAFEKEALNNVGLLNSQIPPRYSTTYFNHVWGGGYAAGYYSYLWTEVLAVNVADYFAKHGALDPAVGQAFRDKVLSRGNTKDQMEMFTDFTGMKQPDASGLLKARGL